MLNRLIKRFFSKEKRSSLKGLEIAKGDVTIDCGANIGLITEELRAKGAVVHSFEPNPHAYAVMQGKFGADPGVHLYNQAVWVKEDTLKLFLHQNHEEDPVKWSTGSSMKVEKKNVNPDSFLEVKTVRLSRFISDLNTKIKVLKIDVEGAEVDILNDLIETGAYLKVDKILVETHETKMPELVQPLEELKKKIKKMNIKNIDLNWI